MTEAEMFKIVKTGQRKRKAWKRKIDKCTFVGDNFTRKPPKYERYIRPTGKTFTHWISRIYLKCYFNYK